MRTALAAGVLVMLAGCAGPRPLPPPAAAMTLPTAWRVTSQGTSVASDWWQSFDDPVLSSLVRAGLENNVDIAVAAVRVEEARAQFQFVNAQRRPNIVAAVVGGRERYVNAFGLAAEQTAGQAQISVSYDTDLFGRLQASSKASQAALLSTRGARDSVRLAIAAGIASGYIGLRTLDARLLVLRDTLAAREQALKLIRRRADAGYAAAIDLRQAEAEFHAAEQAIATAQILVERQEHGLRVLLGDFPGAVPRGNDVFSMTAPGIDMPMPSELLRRRPDIYQAEQTLLGADHSLDAARAAFLPSVQLNAAGGVVESTLLDDPINVFSLGDSILAPIFDAGRLRAQQSIAASRRDQAAFAYRKVVLTAFREVADGLSSLTHVTEQERAVNGQRDSLAAALVLATRRYREGYSPYLEQIDAQRSLLAADLALLQARSDHLLALVALYQALGGGWQP